MASFNVRVDDNFLTRFDKACEDAGTKREPQVRALMERWLNADDEQYYTVRAYSDDHKRWASFRKLDDYFNWDSDGFEVNTPDWRRLEHAADLAERGMPGDKEQAIKLLQEIFGERNVFLKND